jgi:hypothetical protein
MSLIWQILGFHTQPNSLLNGVKDGSDDINLQAGRHLLSERPPATMERGRFCIPRQNRRCFFADGSAIENRQSLQTDTKVADTLQPVISGRRAR